MASKKKIPAGGPGEPGAPAPAQPPVDFITKLELYLEKNWRKVVILLALAVAGVVVYFFIKYKREDEMTVSNNAFTSATTRSDFEDVIKKHPGTAAAGSALYEIADRQLAASETEAARASLEKFVADFSDHPLYYNALLGLGSIHANVGDLDKAESYLKQVVDAGDKSSLAPLATIHRAELLVSKGDLEGAKAIYDTFGPDFKGSPFVQKASERLAALEVRIKREAAPKPPVEPEPAPEPKPEIDPKPAPGGTGAGTDPVTPTPTPTPGAPNTPTDPAAGGTTQPAENGETDPAAGETTDTAEGGETEPAAGGTTEPAENGETSGGSDPAAPAEGGSDPSAAPAAEGGQE